MKKSDPLLLRFSFAILLVSTSPKISFAAPEIGAMFGMSSSNVQAPTRVYGQYSAHFGADVTLDSTEALRIGAFWEANQLTARSGQPAPFHTGGDVSGLAHFFGALLRFQLAPDSPLFVDLKLGVNGRSVGAPPPSSDLAPGLGGAIGYRFIFCEKFSLSPRIGYRVMSYSVNDAAHYAHQGYDINLLLGWAL